MAKIVIYEDSENDLISRYAGLTKNHDVYVRHERRGNFGPSSLRWDYGDKRFKINGFNTDNFQNGYGDPSQESADVYFLDGLRGFCLEIIEKLPKERAFINTDSSSIIQEAKQRGYNVVEGSVKDIVSRFSM